MHVLWLTHLALSYFSRSVHVVSSYFCLIGMRLRSECCAYVYLCVYVCTCAFVCVCACICACIYVCMCVCACIYVCMCVCLCIFACVYICICTFFCVCVWTYGVRVCLCRRTRACTMTMAWADGHGCGICCRWGDATFSARSCKNFLRVRVIDWLMSDWLIDWVSDWVSQWMIDDWLIDWVGEWVSECASVQLT